MLTFVFKVLSRYRDVKINKSSMHVPSALNTVPKAITQPCRVSHCADIWRMNTSDQVNCYILTLWGVLLVRQWEYLISTWTVQQVYYKHVQCEGVKWERHLVVLHYCWKLPVSPWLLTVRFKQTDRTSDWLGPDYSAGPDSKLLKWWA